MTHPPELKCYPETAFGGFTDIDGTVAFYTRVNSLIDSSFITVDFGCGRGSHSDDHVSFRRHLRSLKGKVSKVIGLDIDDTGTENSYIDEFHKLDVNRGWPLASESINIIVCDCVVEHLPEPGSFFSEAARVLARGGYLCIRTPNASSYIGVISRCIPNKYHRKVLSLAQASRKSEDVFHTMYRCNTPKALRKHMLASGFRCVVYGYESEPTYLHFSSLAYRLGAVYQKFVPGAFRSAIFAFGQKN